MGKTFGVRSDGTLSFCRAKPENRGSHGCPHGDGEHFEITDEQLSSGFLKRHNEEALEKHLAAGGVDLFSAMKGKKEKVIRNTFEEHEFINASTELASQLPQEDFDLVRKFYGEYQSYAQDTEEYLQIRKDLIPPDLFQQARKRLSEYLKGDTPYAVSLRDYLGDGTDMENIAELLVNELGAMTAAVRWGSQRKISVARSFLSTLNNDMNRENYVISVLYFKGRCCYCRRTLARSSDAQPTGEHITPITPENLDSPMGGTRFGNMALACAQCNKERGNKELKGWLNSATTMSKAEKIPALARITAFRKFTGYRDYSPEEMIKIKKSIDRIQEKAESLRDKMGKIVPGEGEKVRILIEEELEKLSSSVR